MYVYVCMSVSQDNTRTRALQDMCLCSHECICIYDSIIIYLHTTFAFCRDKARLHLTFVFVLTNSPV